MYFPLRSWEEERTSFFFSKRHCYKRDSVLKETISIPLYFRSLNTVALTSIEVTYFIHKTYLSFKRLPQYFYRIVSWKKGKTMHPCPSSCKIKVMLKSSWNNKTEDFPDCVHVCASSSTKVCRNLWTSSGSFPALDSLVFSSGKKEH